MKFQTQKIIGITLSCLMIILQTAWLTYCLILLNHTPYFIGIIVLGGLLLTYFIYALIRIIYAEEDIPEEETNEEIDGLNVLNDTVDELIKENPRP